MFQIESIAYVKFPKRGLIVLEVLVVIQKHCYNTIMGSSGLDLHFRGITLAAGWRKRREARPESGEQGEDSFIYPKTVMCMVRTRC